jgi:hypothetical protein
LTTSTPFHPALTTKSKVYGFPVVGKVKRGCGKARDREGKGFGIEESLDRRWCGSHIA